MKRSLAILATGLAALPLTIAAWPGWHNPLRDTDLWWLMRTGQDILAGRIPHENSYSWTAPRELWICHEPVIAGVYAAVGLAGVGLVRGILVSLTAILLARTAWRKESHIATVVASCWVASLIVFGHSERPLTWGNFMLAALMALLELSTWRSRHAMAAVLVGAWAWVHGSFVIGLLVLIVYSWQWGLIAAGLTLLNPYGLQLWLFVGSYGTGAGSKAWIHAHVPEWFPLDPHIGIVAAMLVFAALAPLLALWKRDWRGLTLAAFLFPLAIFHQRFIDVFAIALLPAVARGLAGLPGARPISNPAWVVAVAMAAMAVGTPRPAVDGASFPAALLPAIPPYARLWNDWPLGGWLAYHHRAPFWDTRNDPYPLDVLEDGLRVTEQGPGWQSTLDRWQIEYVITAAPGLAGALKGDGWTEVARDGPTRLLRRPAVVGNPASASAESTVTVTGMHRR
jgi:hypothetical protein